MPTPVVIGTPDSFVQIVVTGRPFAKSTDMYDRDFLACAISGRSGGFHFTLDQAGLQIADLTSFHADLQAIYDRLRGEASLRPMEPWIDLRLAGDGRGHLNGTVHVRTLTAPDTSLQYPVSFDQTYLPDLLASIDETVLDQTRV